MKNKFVKSSLSLNLEKNYEKTMLLNIFILLLNKYLTVTLNEYQ